MSELMNEVPKPETTLNVNVQRGQLRYGGGGLGLLNKKKRNNKVCSQDADLGATSFNIKITRTS